MAWKIDPSHSLVEFTVKHMMIAKVRGRFNRYDGTLNLDLENPQNSTIEGTIEAESLDTNEANRDGHLRSADFFDVETYPQITFRSTRIEPKGGDQYKVVGDLTIRGITNEVVLDVVNEGQNKDPWGNQRIGFTATTAINRKEFGLTWNAALETGGFMVGDEVKITIEGELVQQQEQPTEDAASA